MQKAILAAAVEQAVDGIVVTDAKGMIQFVNPAFTAMTGYTSEEAVGQHTRLLKSGRHLAGFYQELWKTIRSGQAWRGQMINRRKDGTDYHEEMRITPVKGSSGEIERYIAIKHDVTERRAAGDAIRESEQRFRIMADGCPAPMWVTDAIGGNQFVNRAYRQFAGAAFEQVEGDKWALVLHPDDAPEYVAEFQRAVREHKAFNAEARLRHASGEWRWIASHAEPRFSEDGEYLGHVGISPDITKRKQAEQESQFQHSLIRAILDVSPDGILVANRENVLELVSQKFLDIWQVPGLVDQTVIGVSGSETSLRCSWRQPSPA